MDKCKYCNSSKCNVSKFEHDFSIDDKNCPACIAFKECLDRTFGVFWVLWCEQSDKPITTKYTTFEQALKVKTIMEEKYPESTFHIMEKVND